MRVIRSALVAVAVGLVLSGCSSGSGGATEASAAPDVTICEPSGTVQADADLPRVAAVADAVAALEAELGGPQEYFEINATARVVNLFVALNDASLVQTWAYVDGELSSQAPQAASGGTFASADLDFDAGLVLGPTREEIPDSIIETFYVHGDGTGAVQYGLLTSAQCGGGLEVTVGPDGDVRGVDPL